MMRDARQTLEATYLEMRWRALSLAADLDRIERAAGSGDVMNDPRLQNLRKCFDVLLHGRGGDRAAQVQLILSDMTAP